MRDPEDLYRVRIRLFLFLILIDLFQGNPDTDTITGSADLCGYAFLEITFHKIPTVGVNAQEAVPASNTEGKEMSLRTY